MQRHPDVEEKLRAAFASDSLNPSQHERLQALLQGAARSESKSQTRAPAQPLLPPPRLHLWQSPWFVASGWALAAALLVSFAIQNLGTRIPVGTDEESSIAQTTETTQNFEPTLAEQQLQKDQDILELTSLFPADFEIQDNHEDLEPIVRSYLGDRAQDFAPTVPEHILASYIPSEGRMLTWHGKPAVSLDLKPRDTAPSETLNTENPTEAEAGQAKGNARLFIVHDPSDSGPSGPDSSFFNVTPSSVPTSFEWTPSESSSASPQYGRIWREGSLTYIVVGHGDD